MDQFLPNQNSTVSSFIRLSVQWNLVKEDAIGAKITVHFMEVLLSWFWRKIVPFRASTTVRCLVNRVDRFYCISFVFCSIWFGKTFAYFRYTVDTLAGSNTQNFWWIEHFSQSWFNRLTNSIFVEGPVKIQVIHQV